ncbi:MAG: orotate phosphoribosyltransferase [Candidatus Methanofastidiosa archaeon]|nr:orotate phosphoribosyltransferase [Candidatus Methanofastidiosa archaeon]
MHPLHGYQKDLVNVLVESRALAFGQFTLKSGRVSPYFFNMGQAVSNGMYLSTVTRCYCSKLVEHARDDFTFVFGPAYKGIPLACSIAFALWTNYDRACRWGYDRKEEKGYGDARDKVLVGDLRDGDRIIMVDDVITTGGTKIESWKKIRTLAEDLSCGGILVAVDREERDAAGMLPSEVLKDAGLDVTAILKVSDIFHYLHEHDINGTRIVDDELYQQFMAYREHYG